MAPKRRLLTSLDLPPELIFNILSCLPTKDLLRFMCVCRDWNAMIRNEKFIKDHHDRSTKTNSPRFLILESEIESDSDSDIESDIESPSQYSCLSVSFEGDVLGKAVTIQRPLQHLDIVGCCNGLVCLINYDTEADLAIWNPSIQRFKKIPLPDDIEQPANAMKSKSSYGFGYDSTNDDYKLVRVGEDTSVEAYAVEIYSQKSNSWKKIQSLPCNLGMCFHYSQTFLTFFNGALHWLMRQQSDYKLKHVALDLASDKYEVFPFPPGDAKIGPRWLELEVLGDQLLCVSGKHGVRRRSTRSMIPSRNHVWVLKEYGVAASWTWLYAIEDGAMPIKFRYCKPLVYSKMGNMVLYEVDGHMLCWYDLEKNKGEQADINLGMPSTPFTTTICEGSLRLLDGDRVAIYIETQQQQGSG